MSISDRMVPCCSYDGKGFQGMAMFAWFLVILVVLYAEKGLASIHTIAVEYHESAVSYDPNAEYILVRFLLDGNDSDGNLKQAWTKANQRPRIRLSILSTLDLRKTPSFFHPPNPIILGFALFRSRVNVKA